MSHRETEILRLMAADSADLEIAHDLVLTARTRFHAHLRSNSRKLGSVHVLPRSLPLGWWRRLEPTLLRNRD